MSESPSSEAGVHILESNPEFKQRVGDESAILGYSRKLYAQGLVDLYPDGSEYRGHVCNAKDLNFWNDYGPKCIAYASLLRQLELQQSGKIDELTGGRDDANYNSERDHYIVYETRRESDENSIHADNADSTYLYEVGTRDVGRVQPKGQAAELLDSVRLPQGTIIERFYLKHARSCPLGVFVEAYKEAGGVEKLLATIDTSKEDEAKRFIMSQSYMSLTAAADHIDKSEYDYVLLPDKRLIVLNHDALINLKDTEVGLLHDEEMRLQRLYKDYLAVNPDSSVERGSEADGHNFINYMRAL
jgi:hypothetical protein